MTDISIIIPAYNEVRFIQQTLARLARAISQSQMAYEILVVDNGSTDHTASLAAACENVQVLKLEKRRTISAARNAGASKANGILLAFIDADVFVTAAWTKNLQRRFADLASANLITGAQYRISESPGWIERYWFKSMEERQPNYINGGNLIVSKALFERLKGFRHDLVTGEDVEFCRRAKKQGVDVDPDAEFAVHHEGYPKGLRSFFKRELWAGRGDLSSVTAFMESKTAITAVIAVSLLVVSVGLLVIGSWGMSASLALVVVVISMASVKYKYGFHSVGRFVVNTAVMIVHLVARAMAFVNFEKKA